MMSPTAGDGPKAEWTDWRDRGGKTSTPAGDCQAGQIGCDGKVVASL
jgi:hypothetical protein